MRPSLLANHPDSSETWIPADRVVLAFGLQPSPAPWRAQYNIALDAKGRVQAPANAACAYQTSNPKVFAGGDTPREFLTELGGRTMSTISRRLPGSPHDEGTETGRLDDGGIPAASGQPRQSDQV